jgi:hypothetical protein
LVRDISSLGKSWRNKTWDGTAAELLNEIRPCVAEVFFCLSSFTQKESSSLDWSRELLELIASAALDPVLALFVLDRLPPAPEEFDDFGCLQLMEQSRWEHWSLSAFLAFRDPTSNCLLRSCRPTLRKFRERKPPVLRPQADVEHLCH